MRSKECKTCLAWLEKVRAAGFEELLTTKEQVALCASMPRESDLQAVHFASKHWDEVAEVYPERLHAALREQIRGLKEKHGL